MNKTVTSILLIAIVTAAIVGVVYVYAATQHITYNDGLPQQLLVIDPTPSPTPSPSPTPIATPTPAPTPIEVVGNQAITFNANPLTTGTDLVVTVTLTPPAATPVTLYINGNPAGTTNSTAAGVATFTFPADQVGAGTYTVTSSAASVTTT